MMKLEARDIVVVRDGRRVLDGASLAIESGEVATLSGPSGGGKTTLVRVMATLEEPDDGAVTLDESDVRTVAPREARRRVAYVLQQSPMLDGSVKDNVAAGPRLAGRRIADDAIVTLLERVGLDRSFAARPAKELSGGEQQRVALARALANEPRALLLDEPTSALDPESAQRVVALVKELARAGLAVLVVTHAAEQARAMADVQWTLENGRASR